MLVLAGTAAGGATDPLAEQIAQYKKAGEPIEVTDFVVAPMPDADNAAIELKAAGDALKDRTPAWQSWDKFNDVRARLSDAELAALKAVVAENAAVIEHVDAAMKRKGVVWPVPIKSPAIDVLLPHLNHQRGVANLIQAHALLRDHEGDHAEALRDVQRLIFLSRATDRQAFLINHLVSLGIMRMASDLVEQIAPDLKIGDEMGAGTSQQAKEVIAALLDDGPPGAGIREG